MRTQKIITLKVSELKLWTENPRDAIEATAEDIDILKNAIQNHRGRWSLKALLQSMGTYYDYSEIPTVVNTDGKYVVYDGNRRIALLKYLQNIELQKELKEFLTVSEKHEGLKSQLTVPCNVCDEQTALETVLRKHGKSGTWTPLDQDIFMNKHMGNAKSHFLWLEEQTGLIDKNSKMNQGFVRDEVLSINNLKDIGFQYDENNGFKSNRASEIDKAIFDAIVQIVENKEITTRIDRGSLKKVLVEKHSNLSSHFIDNLKNTVDAAKFAALAINSNILESNELKKNRTRVTNPNIELFGGPLSLKQGEVNNLYRAIENIYIKTKTDENSLRIVAMSLRLIIEVAAREHYRKTNDPKKIKDVICGEFLQEAKKIMTLDSQTMNYLAVTSEWLNSSLNLEAILAKYAHGNISVSRAQVVNDSLIVADILKHYFGK